MTKEFSLYDLGFDRQQIRLFYKHVPAKNGLKLTQVNSKKEIKKAIGRGGLVLSKIDNKIRVGYHAGRNRSFNHSNYSSFKQFGMDGHELISGINGMGHISSITELLKFIPKGKYYVYDIRKEGNYCNGFRRKKNINEHSDEISIDAFMDRIFFRVHMLAHDSLYKRILELREKITERMFINSNGLDLKDDKDYFGELDFGTEVYVETFSNLTDNLKAAAKLYKSDDVFTEHLKKVIEALLRFELGESVYQKRYAGRTQSGPVITSPYSDSWRPTRGPGFDTFRRRHKERTQQKLNDLIRTGKRTEGEIINSVCVSVIWFYRRLIKDGNYIFFWPSSKDEEMISKIFHRK